MASGNMPGDVESGLKALLGKNGGQGKGRAGKGTGNSQIGREDKAAHGRERGRISTATSGAFHAHMQVLTQHESPILFKLEAERRTRCSHTTWQTTLASSNMGRIENG